MTTSIVYDANQELIFQEIQQSEILIEQNNLITALLFLKRLDEKNPPYPILYYRLALCYFQTKQYQNAFQTIDKCFQYENFLLDIKLKLQIIKLFLNICSILKKDNKKILEYLQKLIIENNLDNDIYIRFEKIEYLNFQQPNIQSQVDTFQAIDKLEQQDKLLETQGLSVYLIDFEWFKKWRCYVQLENSPFQQDDPGFIDQSNLLSQKQNIVLDFDCVKTYSNIKIKKNLIENQDFVIVSHLLWKYFQNIYGGIEIQRFIIKDNSNLISYEIYLKKINLYYKNEKYKLQISKYDFVIDLEQKIIRIFKLQNQIRLIKIKKNQENYQNLNENDILDKNTGIQDLNFSKEDAFLIDYKSNNQWTVQLQAAQKIEKCGHCKTQSNQLLSCACRSIKYCNEICQKQHFSQHNQECRIKRKTIEEKKNKLNQLNISEPQQIQQRKGLTGLQNLGNTCFMNSTLQCLSNIQFLTDYFITNQFLKDINLNNPLGMEGKLAATYSEMLKNIWCKSDRSYNPWELKKTIAQKATQFAGNNQQDSFEFLNYIIDGLHEDLNKIIRKPFVEVKDYDGRSDQIFSQEAWDRYKLRNDSIIVDNMFGQFKSTLTCPDCKKISITFDPYFSISVPIPFNQRQKYQFYLVTQDINQIPIMIDIYLDKNTKISQIKKIIVQQFQFQNSQLLFAGLDGGFNIQQYYNDNDDLSQLEQNNFKFIYELLNVDQLTNLIIFIKGDQNNEGYQSYPRILQIQNQITYNDLHLLVYQNLRFNLQFCNLISINIDLKNKQQIFNEYEKNLANGIPYKLYIQDKQLKKCDEIINLQQINEIHLKFNQSSAILSKMKLIACEKKKINQIENTDDQDIHIYQCLDIFQKPEILDKDNEWYCNQCKKHKQSQKRIQIYKTPNILIFHLKRFKTSRSEIGRFVSIGGQKIDINIDFPIKNLDLSQYVIEQNNEIFDLIGISNHYGTMYGGHYTAYCKNFIDQKWYEFNDSQVSQYQESKVVTNAAFILFYKKRI